AWWATSGWWVTQGPSTTSRERSTRRGKSRRTSDRTDGRPVSGSLLRDAHHELAEVAPLEHADERGRGILQPVDDVLAVAHPPVAHPLRHVHPEVRVPLFGELGLDEPADGQALHQHLLVEPRQAV